jgi:M6 family metalloprotease-like protein
MKKSQFKKFIIIPVGGLLLIGLSSCNLWSLFTNKSATTSGLTIADKDGKTYDAPSLSFSASGTNFSAKATSINEEEANYASGYVMPSTGKVNLLVIPVVFDDYKGNATEAVREDIYQTFFGDPSDTSWESLASYYYKSSYGQLLINGTVAPWYDSGYTTSEFSQLKFSGASSYAKSWEPTWNIVEDATAWYAKSYSSDLSEFDSNNDNVVDAIWFVYSAPDVTNNSSLDSTDFWAYTYSDLLSYETAMNNGGKSSTCIPFRYSWASYDFMRAGYGDSGRDAHTYVHETGHLMGLDDYYVSSTTSTYPNNYGPMGRLDMMDYNIIDHDAYSKFALGWIKPYVVTGTTSITLEPSSTTGQAILLPTTTDGWNGSAFDEYMLLEFYTPTLLNKQDSLAAYPDNKTQGFTENGIRIYHVDSRLALLTGSSVSYSDKVVRETSTSASYTMVAHGNGAGYNANMGTTLAFRLVQEMDCTKKRNFDTDYETITSGGKTKRLGCTADNSTLFQAGDSFSFSTYSGSFPTARMNDGNAFPFTVNFSTMSSISIQVDITAN